MGASRFPGGRHVARSPIRLRVARVRSPPLPSTLVLEGAAQPFRFEMVASQASCGRRPDDRRIAGQGTPPGPVRRAASRRRGRLQQACEQRGAPGLAVDAALATMGSAIVARPSAEPQQGDILMLWAILVILLVLWALGLVGSIGGGFIHLLLVLAVIVLAVQLLQGRRSV
jgi:hypothetical protein